MLSNYLTIALRNLRKNSLYSGLNVFGLALGIAACLLIALYVAYERSYDHWNANADRTMRIVADINFGGTRYEEAVIGAPIAPDAAREIPEVQSWCRLRERGPHLVRRDGQMQSNIREDKVLFVDSTFFEVFPLKILQGDAARCLAQPGTVAISRSRAERYFASPEMALGQTLVLENNQRVQVTAVYEDMPQNSHFRADLLRSLVNDEEIKRSPPFWGSNNNFHTYLLLRPGTDNVAFAQKFERLCREKFVVTAQQMLGTTLADFEKTGQYIRFYPQQVTDIHLQSNLGSELSPGGNIRYVWIFSAIAAFILLIACINFMNLATARSSMRAKEIGVRKALGSSRRALTGQFLTESVLVVALAVVLAVGIAALAMPGYRILTGHDALQMPWGEPIFWLTLVGGTLLTGLLAGMYPAFFLSAFSAIKVLKGEAVGAGPRSGGLRSALVVFQFSIATALILSTLLVSRQLNFIQTKNLGFEKEQVIVVDNAYALGDRTYHFKEEMLKNPLIESGTVSGYLPVPSNRSDQGFMKNRSITLGEIVQMQRWRVDNDYFNTMNIELHAGRLFDPARQTDSMGIVLNESAVKLFGFGDPIGQKIYTLDKTPNGPPRPEDYQALEIIGVVKDFHWASLRDNIGALCFRLGQSRGSASFRYKGRDTKAVIAALEQQWKSMAPEQPFAYRFLDDAFDKMYRAEQRVGRLAGIFAVLAVLISCLGLFGLAAYTAERRTKEIGIRKVLGASIANITGLLAKDFLKLVLLAIVIASPIAWYVMNQWLSDFAYRIEISWWMFAAAGALALLIAFLTVGFQSVKAALANPARSLKSE